MMHRAAAAALLKLKKMTKFEKKIKEKGYNLHQVSQAAGIPHGTLYNWTSGRCQPKINNINWHLLCKWCQSVGIKVSFTDF